jgi:hypothetical protein
MSAISEPHLARVGARLRSYGTRRYALLLALAIIHLGLLIAAGLLVAGRITAGPIQVFAIGLLAIMAAIVAVWPGSAAALVFIVGCGVSYIVLSAMESAIGIEASTPRAYEVLGLAAALFLIHAVDALREILPADAAIESAVMIRWVQRTAEALVPGLVLGALLIALPTASDGGLFWLVGALGLLTAVGLPALAMRPRPWSDPDRQGR